MTATLELIQRLWAKLNRAEREAHLDWTLNHCATCGRAGKWEGGGANGMYCDACMDLWERKDCWERGREIDVESLKLIEKIQHQYADEFWDQFPRALALFMDTSHGRDLERDPGLKEQTRKQFVAAIEADAELRAAVLAEFFHDLQRRADELITGDQRQRANELIKNHDAPKH
jgi:hypothetical protein